MNFSKEEKTIKFYLEAQEAVAFYDDFLLVICLGYDYTWAGDFVYSNLQESVRKQSGFVVDLSTVAVKELLKDLTKLSREIMISRVTKNLIDNLTYFLMSDNQKIKPYSTKSNESY